MLKRLGDGWTPDNGRSNIQFGALMLMVTSTWHDKNVLLVSRRHETA